MKTYWSGVLISWTLSSGRQTASQLFHYSVRFMQVELLILQYVRVTPSRLNRQ
ncbi:hypothetical protein D922_02773 [Enterococcus faecalis 06-MB-DW-09]|nr:hypothetical protein D922_02773 [Enterococcus faecalis 06-MB-DW-09]